MTNSAVIFGSTLHFATRARVPSPFAVLGCSIPPAFHVCGHVYHGHMRLSWNNRRLRRFSTIVRATSKSDDNKKKKKWWHKFLLHEVDDGTWFGLNDQISDGHMEDAGVEEGGFDVVTEVSDFQENGRDPDMRDWEDWLDYSWRRGIYSSSSDAGKGWNDYEKEEEEVKDWDAEGVPREKPSMPERGMYRNIKELFFRVFERPNQLEDDLTYEDKVFEYTTQITAKFVALLVLVPWAVGFVFHDYVMVPFLNRYVELVPFAAQLLDVRKDQKLEMVEDLKREKLRLHFEAEIRMAPPPSEEEIWEHMRHKARELREELRLENRKSFANIWSDMIAAITAFIIYVFNQSKVEIMKFTASRILKGISDTGKAFLLILVTDIFLGYHSESGWHTLIEMLLEHYGLMADEATITVFICTVPVAMDVWVKFWVFKYLPRLSPSTAATFHEMKRH